MHIFYVPVCDERDKKTIRTTTMYTVNPGVCTRYSLFQRPEKVHKPQKTFSSLQVQASRNGGVLWIVSCCGHARSYLAR